MAEKYDFVVTLQGGTRFNRMPESAWRVFNGANDQFHPLYRQAVIARGEDRRITEFAGGADTYAEKLDNGGELPSIPNSSVLDYVVNNIHRVAKSNFGNVGVVCLAGCSNGSALVLGIASVLQACNPPVSVNYIGLVDLPMFAYGRSPPIRGVGDFKFAPYSAEDGWGAKTPSGVGPPPGPASIKPLTPAAPKVRLQSEIRARTKENFYQTEGQRLSLLSNWTSNMAYGEVHGEVEGWGAGNIKTVSVDYGVEASDALTWSLVGQDDNFHNKICKFMFETKKIASRIDQNLALL